ncbi:MAG: fibronectin type III domain-containing protein [Pirellulaceae bacterium]
MAEYEPLLIVNAARLEDRKMNRSLLLGILIFFGVVGIALLGDQPQAVAGHGCHGMVRCAGCYGVPACDGYYGVPGCGGCYGYAAPVVAYRPRFLRHGWYGRGSCYGYASCFGGGGCYGISDCYGYTGCYGYTMSYAYDCFGCAGTVVEGNVIQKGEVTGKPAANLPAPAAEEPAPGDDSLLAPPKPPAEIGVDDGSAMLKLRVPKDAVVIINDYTTNSIGSERRYVSRGLEPGRKYRFEIRADLNRGGETVSQTKVVQLEATKVVDLVFDFDVAQVARVSH